MRKLRKKSGGTSCLLEPRGRGVTAQTARLHGTNPGLIMLSYVCSTTVPKTTSRSWSRCPGMQMNDLNSDLHESRQNFSFQHTGDLNAAFWSLSMVSYTSSDCIECKEVASTHAKLCTRYADHKIFCSLWYQGGSIFRAIGLLWFLFLLVCLGIFKAPMSLMWQELAAGVERP